jgi:hypothetical protein
MFNKRQSITSFNSSETQQTLARKSLSIHSIEALTDPYALPVKTMAAQIKALCKCLPPQQQKQAKRHYKLKLGSSKGLFKKAKAAAKGKVLLKVVNFKPDKWSFGKWFKQLFSKQPTPHCLVTAEHQYRAMLLSCINELVSMYHAQNHGEVKLRDGYIGLFENDKCVYALTYETK